MTESAPMSLPEAVALGRVPSVSAELFGTSIIVTTWPHGTNLGGTGIVITKAQATALRDSLTAILSR